MFDFQVFGAGLDIQEATVLISGEGPGEQMLLTTTNCRISKLFHVYLRARISFLWLS